MGKRTLVIIVLVAHTVLFSGVQKSWGYVFGAPADSQPSLFRYGWQGLFLGALAGLAGGYVRYADTADNSNDILRSVGYGSLVGIGFGLVVGIGEAASGETGIGGIIIRDMHLGGLLGLTAGTIWGGIGALNDKKWETVGKGAAWGYLGGLVFGLGVALLEGPGVLSGSTTARGPLTHGVAFYQDSRLMPYPGYGIHYSF